MYKNTFIYINVGNNEFLTLHFYGAMFNYWLNKCRYIIV